MGTTYTVKYLSNNRDKLPSPAEIQKRIDDALKEVNLQMSTYQPDSEIQLSSTNTQLASPSAFQATAHVTAEAVRLNRLTHGAPGRNRRPLGQPLGIRPRQTVDREPSPKQIKQAASYTGIDKIILKQGKDYASLSKTHPKAYLDLSSIAKGFGVDKVAGELENTAFKIIWSKSAASCTAKAKRARRRTLAHRHRTAQHRPRRQYADYRPC